MNKKNYTDKLVVEVDIEAFYEYDRRGIFADTLRVIADKIENGDGECQMDDAHWTEKVEVGEEDRLQSGWFQDGDARATFVIKPIK